ncbi:MAG: Flp pilus assembly protein CpaB [Alphaproteobacteria bacterium]|nr:Flp pilus assembly protein CpaB [Alphaproteobacteria bacterium]
MNLMRIIILVAAIAAAGLTAILVSSLVSTPEVAVDKAPKIPVNQVLVAARKIEIGTKLTEADLRWQEFPEPSVASVYFTRDRNPEAVKEHVGGIARAEIFSDSPITPGKIVNAGGGGFMSAILEGGMRAMSVQIAPETGAGGFILPGDRVDVLLSYETQVEEESGRRGKEVVSEIILENVRALAIDQTVNDPAGSDSKGGTQTSSVIGKTATLELTPAQAQKLAKSVASGRLALALRSLERKEDAEFAAREAAAAAALEAERSKNKSFTIIRYGTPGKFRPN